MEFVVCSSFFSKIKVKSSTVSNASIDFFCLKYVRYWLKSSLRFYQILEFLKIISSFILLSLSIYPELWYLETYLMKRPESATRKDRRVFDHNIVLFFSVEFSCIFSTNSNSIIQTNSNISKRNAFSSTPKLSL